MTRDCGRPCSAEGLMKGVGPLILILAAMSVDRASAKDGPQAVALNRSSSPIVLEGRLDEPEWREAAALTVVQQSPKPGAATEYETKVRIIVSDDRLYFG